MDKLVDRIEGIGGEYLWEELGEAIPDLILRFSADLVLGLEGEREREEGARLGRGREEGEKERTAREGGSGETLFTTLAPAIGALSMP